MLTHKALFPTLFPTRSLARDVALALAGSVLVALLAQLSVPFYPVPLTGQTLGVLLVGALLGSRLGFLSLALYLLEGFVLPVFAEGKTWPAVTFSAGYLVAFPFAAFVVGWLVERFAADRDVLKSFGAMLVANVLIYVPGLIWLGMALSNAGYYEGFSKLLEAGLTPFLLGDLLKASLAAVLLPAAWQLLKRR
ncbi:MAG: biotin transporter BioY [Trueperaceae bacterium]